MHRPIKSNLILSSLIIVHLITPNNSKSCEVKGHLIPKENVGVFKSTQKKATTFFQHFFPSL